MKDAHKILGISRGVSETEIKSAYKKRARECHPDLHPNDPNAAQKFNTLTEARNFLLSQPTTYKSKIQTGSGNASKSPQHGQPATKQYWDKSSKVFDLEYETWSDSFRAWTKWSGGRRSSTTQLTIAVDTTLELARIGFSTRVEYPKIVICPSCNGRYRRTQCNECWHGHVIVDFEETVSIPKLPATSHWYGHTRILVPNSKNSVLTGGVVVKVNIKR